MTRNQLPKKSKPCLCCKKKFTPDPRVGNRQQHCSRKGCQKKRQRQNEKSWREENPDAVVLQQVKWQKKHPEYWPQWRENHPEYLRRNKKFMRQYMRRARKQLKFVKSKEMALQLADIKGVVKREWYVSKGCGWLIVRLQRASRWSNLSALGHTSGVRHRLPRGRLYDVSEMLRT